MSDIHLRHFEEVERTEASHESFSITACGILIRDTIKASLSRMLVTCPKCKKHTT
jgi:hypothetical protein